MGHGSAMIWQDIALHLKCVNDVNGRTGDEGTDSVAESVCLLRLHQRGIAVVQAKAKNKNT